jgi:hypothetical protein
VACTLSDGDCALPERAAELDGRERTRYLTAPT